jgi:hypothetical protein
LTIRFNLVKCVDDTNKFIPHYKTR